MRAISVLLVTILLVTTAGLNAAPPTYTMTLKAHPQAIVADGRSETTVSAEVYDASGNPVPDGTAVDFTSSIGSIERSARTIAGVARVRLQSIATVGTAMISAVVENGNAVGQLRVDFLEPGTAMFTESFITISSKKYLGYDVSGRIIDSAGGVTISSRGLTITAEEAQIDLKTNILKARCQMGGDNIIVRRGDKRIEASELYYDFNAMTGILLTPASEGAKRMTFRGRDLYSKAATEDADQKKSLDYKPVTESSMFIKASSMVIRPGEEVKFKRAVFYMDGSKMLKVPLYVVSLRGSGGGAGQMLSYGSNGVRMDLPFYYSLTPNSTGAFRLRRSDLGSWGYYANSGLQLDMQEDYNFNGSTDGSFVLDHITNVNDWGAKWTNRMQFENDSQIYSYVDFPMHRSLFGSLNYSRSFHDYSLSINSRATKALNANGTIASDMYLQTRAKPVLGGAFNYSITSRLVADTSLRGRFGSGLGLQLYSKPLKLGPLGNLTQSLIAGENWGAYGGPTLTANTGLTRAIGRSGSMGLNYSYDYANQATLFSSQRLSLNMNYMPPSMKWNAFFNATRGLTDGSISAFGDFSYQAAPTWRLDMLGTYQKFGAYNYPDVQFAVAKTIGKQDFSIVWSSAIHRFSFQFSALRF